MGAMLVALRSTRTLVIIGVALVVAFISAKLLPQGTLLVALPWGVLAFLTASVAGDRQQALALGSCLGFVVSYAYLWFDNTSTLTLPKVVILIFLIVIPSLFGLLCGLLAAWVGWIVRQRFDATTTSR
jgi:hypothetical protein